MAARQTLIVLTAVLAAACIRSEAAIEESPLATWDPSGVELFHDATVGSGTLRITDDCVLLQLDNAKQVLLVWPEPTSWNPSTQTIEFVSPRAEQERMELRDGDQLRPGGSAVVGDVAYISSSTRECDEEAEETFRVNRITPVE